MATRKEEKLRKSIQNTARAAREQTKNESESKQTYSKSPSKSDSKSDSKSKTKPSDSESRAEKRGRGSGFVGAGLTKNPQSPKFVAAHRHCMVCNTPVGFDQDPAVCGKEKCSTEHATRERKRKQLNILLYLFPAIAILLVFLPILRQ